jgi:hypothetical protein
LTNLIPKLRATKDHFGNSLAERRTNRNILPKPVFYILVSLALVGPLLFQVTSTILAYFWNGYNLIKDAISILVFGHYGWLQTTVFFMFGISMVALAIILFCKIRVKFNAGAIMLILMGICFFLIGINETQMPGGPSSTSAIIHRIATASILLFFPIACFLIAPGLKSWRYNGLSKYSKVVGVFSILFLFIGGTILVIQFNLLGIFERIMLLNGQIWLTTLCICLIATDMKIWLKSRKKFIRQPSDILSDILKTPDTAGSFGRYRPDRLPWVPGHFSAERSLSYEPVKISDSDSQKYN